MEWLFEQTAKALSAIASFLTTPILQIGNRGFSIGYLAVLVLLAILIFISARFISEWLKHGLLSRFERGLREAIATITSYLLALFGLLILLQTAGIDLSSLTVLAGVVGIGVGFGLQNLASNFISGLTLLFEQPIKVGDFIEVDQLMGTVEKISIRSTIVRTPDDVFVIVPNLRFVEQNIINWSYRAPLCRIHVPVGVAYGSDSVIVTEALLESARMEPRVLSHPTPKVWFQSFGESLMNFELLVWINTPADSEPIKSALNFRIERELRRRNIEIPFPQREVYIQNINELAIALGHAQAAPADLASLGGQPGGQPGGQNGGAANLSASSAASLASSGSSMSVSNLSLREMLRRVAYFEQCSDLELRQLIEYGYRQLFPANYTICRENDPGDSFYIILSGSVEVFSQRIDKYIATLHAGEFFGEMSLLLGAPRSATVQTLEESTLFIVDRNDLQKLLMNHVELADQIAQKLAERQQALKEMGLGVEGVLAETPLFWMRKQIQTLFGI